MPISESEQIRIANKIKERNKLAKWINENLKPSSKIKMIKPVTTAKKLATSDDVESIERSLDAFMEAPLELRFESRSSYSMNEMAELMTLGAESERRGREKYEEVKQWIADKGVTMGGVPSNVDPIYWADKFSERVYKYKDPASMRSQYYYDQWKDKMYAKALSLDEVKKLEKYKETYLKTFYNNIVMGIDKGKCVSSMRQEARDIYNALKDISPQEFQYAYFTDVLGDFSFLYPEKENELEYGVAIDVKNVFGIQF